MEHDSLDGEEKVKKKVSCVLSRGYCISTRSYMHRLLIQFEV